MAIRVLAGDEARAASAQLAAIVQGGLAEQLAALKQVGRRLGDPQVWDGALAEQFRSDTWPATEASLDRTTEALLELRAQVEAITTQIMAAGGSA